MADLYGHILGRNRHLLRKENTALQIVTMTAVFDSDIQGQANQDMFKTVIQSLNELPKTEQATGIRSEFKVSIKTEQEEPLLLLPDHLAGYYYSQRVYGETTDNDRRNILHAVEPAIAKWPPTCYRLLEGPFKEEYLLDRNVFDHVLPKKQREELLRQLAGSASSQPEIKARES